MQQQHEEAIRHCQEASKHHQDAARNRAGICNVKSIELLHNLHLLFHCDVAKDSPVLIYAMYTPLLESFAPCTKAKSTGYARALMNAFKDDLKRPESEIIRRR